MKARVRLAASAAILGLALPAFAAAPAALPRPKTEGSVTYVSGGIGSKEAQAMKRAEQRYPLSMTFSEGKRGEYLANVRVTIHNKAGHSVLQAVSGGPIMLVKLPSGDYHVSARIHGKTLQRDAQVAPKGDTHLSFNWPKA